jgi:hypothetical protein
MYRAKVFAALNLTCLLGGIRAMRALQKSASGREIFSATRCNHLDRAANGLIASNYRVPC